MSDKVGGITRKGQGEGSSDGRRDTNGMNTHLALVAFCELLPLHEIDRLDVDDQPERPGCQQRLRNGVWAAAAKKQGVPYC